VTTRGDEGNGRVTPYLSVILCCFSVAQNIYRVAQKSFEAAFLLHKFEAFTAAKFNKIFLG
jgi:hypothetical protein